MWSLVTSIGKGDKSCDFIDQTEQGYYQRLLSKDSCFGYDADLFELNIYTPSVTILEPILRLG